MNIAIIGTGNIGGTLAKKWSACGHKIFLGVRDLDNFKGEELLADSNITALGISDAVKQANVVLVAATPQSVPYIIKSMGNVAGKVIIDAMNSVRTKPEGYENTF